MRILKRVFPLILVLLANINCPAQPDTSRNYFLKNWVPRIFKVPVKTMPIEYKKGTSRNTINIYEEDTIAPFLPTQLGLNTTARSGRGMLSRTEVYRQSGMKAFRFPLGSGSNQYFWDGKIPEKFLIDAKPINATDTSFLHIAEFAAFIDTLDAEATVVVNYFYARYGITKEGTRESRVLQAANYAAGFVNYLNNELKAGIRNWEIGNECYGSWEKGYDVNGNIVTGKEYGEDFRVFAEKMKAADPSIKVGAVMFPKDNNWNDQVMKEVKSHADFLIVHNYFTSDKDATVENILASPPQVNQIKKQMEECIVRNTSYPKDYFPVCMTEYNCRGPFTTTFVNACFTADVVSRLIESQYALATRWVGEWKWRVGTHGLFAVDDPDQVDYSVRQPYLVYHYFGRCFGDYMVKTTSSNKELMVYGSKFSDGRIGLVAINSTPEDISFDVNFSNKKNSGRVYLFEVYANSIAETDKKFFVNGFTSNTLGGGPENVELIPPYSTRFMKNSVFKAKKYSVSFFVFETSN